MLDVQRPILVIGAGRSGSTLITRMLYQHEEIQFCGENNFLVPRLWLELWEDHHWLTGKRFVDDDLRSALDTHPALCESHVQQEMERVGRVIADCLVALLGFNVARAGAWGYKEIWNGTARYNYAWHLYDLVVPRAIWVHLVRNPFDFARSCANWTRDDLTLAYLRDRLSDWKSMVERSRERKETGRFVEIRYEDLVTTPERALSPMLERVGLSWSESCREALNTYRFRSTAPLSGDPRGMVARREIEASIGTLPGLEALVAELGYDIPEGFEAGVLQRESRDHIVSKAPPQEWAGGTLLDRPHKPQHLMKQELERLEARCRWLEQERSYYKTECDRYMNESLLRKIRREVALGRKVKRLLKAGP